jgi:hypothetical protein
LPATPHKGSVTNGATDECLQVLKGYLHEQWKPCHATSSNNLRIGSNRHRATQFHCVCKQTLNWWLGQAYRWV